ncbi:hypothetical protein Slin14017_G104630 [Septoria linicola]|nr:hypothetical protein Slin14017_G104630 [Septoria linicola]
MSSDERTSTAGPQTFASDLHVDVNASKMMPTVASTAKPEGVQKKLRKGTKSCLPCSPRQSKAAARAAALSDRQHKSSRYQQAIRALRSHLPAPEELVEIVENDTSWWTLYRDALGLVWTGYDTMRSFALHVSDDADPSVVALLLVCLAISTGDQRRYLPPVEEHIVNYDEYAGTEYGLNTLMALGLCYMSSLQPRRAWTVYGGANTLLQLNDCILHLRKRSERHINIFWQLFHADRWVSLMIGLPYTVSDHFCDLQIAPLHVLGPGTWLYRHLAVTTGRVIDHLQAQNVKGPILSSAMKIEEQIDEIVTQMPTDYLDIEKVRMCSDAAVKNTRLYRVVHIHLLRSYVHMPFFLSPKKESRYSFSRRSCVDDARAILVAFLEVFDSDPNAAADGTVLNFTAFTAAVIVLLGLIGYGRLDPPSADISLLGHDEDSDPILRTRGAIEQGARTKIAGRLSAKCCSALDSLIASAQSSTCSDPIVLPYFGTLSINPLRIADPELEKQASSANISVPADAEVQATPRYASGVSNLSDSLVAPVVHESNLNSAFVYQGLFLPSNDESHWLSNTGHSSTIGDMDWTATQHFGEDSDWSWLNSDLPPTLL